jgi:Ca2+-binding EF-hand superfamily protein
MDKNQIQQRELNQPLIDTAGDFDDNDSKPERFSAAWRQSFKEEVFATHSILLKKASIVLEKEKRKEGFTIKYIQTLATMLISTASYIAASAWQDIIMLEATGTGNADEFDDIPYDDACVNVTCPIYKVSSSEYCGQPCNDEQKLYTWMVTFGYIVVFTFGMYQCLGVIQVATIQAIKEGTFEKAQLFEKMFDILSNACAFIMSCCVLNSSRATFRSDTAEQKLEFVGILTLICGAFSILMTNVPEMIFNTFTEGGYTGDRKFRIESMTKTFTEVYLPYMLGSAWTALAQRIFGTCVACKEPVLSTDLASSALLLLLEVLFFFGIFSANTYLTQFRPKIKEVNAKRGGDIEASMDEDDENDEDDDGNGGLPVARVKRLNKGDEDGEDNEGDGDDEGDEDDEDEIDRLLEHEEEDEEDEEHDVHDRGHKKSLGKMMHAEVVEKLAVGATRDFLSDMRAATLGAWACVTAIQSRALLLEAWSPPGTSGLFYVALVSTILVSAVAALSDLYLFRREQAIEKAHTRILTLKHAAEAEFVQQNTPGPGVATEKGGGNSTDRFGAAVSAFVYYLTANDLDLSELFDEWDVDHSGYLSPQEFKTAIKRTFGPRAGTTKTKGAVLRGCKRPISDVHIEALIQVLDKDGDGHVRYTELKKVAAGEIEETLRKQVLRDVLIAVKKLTKFIKDECKDDDEHDAQKKLQALFDEWDINGDGTLSRAELIEALRRLNKRVYGLANGANYRGHLLSKKEISSIVDVFDRDGDGDISLEEFAHIAEADMHFKHDVSLSLCINDTPH